MPKLIIGALDGSLRNFGVVKFHYDTDTGALDPVAMHLFETMKSTSKQVRSSSDYYRRARSIAVGVRDKLSDCTLVFAEIPSGGQDYKAVMGFGITIGIYASITQEITEVSPGEAKKVALGTRTGSKQEMIDWAFGLYPNADWHTTKRGGVRVPTQKNEHLADACAIAHAGIRTPEFLKVLAIVSAPKLAV